MTESRFASAPLGKGLLAAVAERLVTDIASFTERNILELLGVLAGLKEVMRIPVTTNEWHALKQGCERLGLVVGHAHTKIAVTRTTKTGDTFTTNVPWDDPRGFAFSAFVARQRSGVDEAIAVEALAGSDSRFGRLFEYPTCCIDAYAHIARGMSWVEAVIGRTTASRLERGANKLAYLFDGASLFPDYFPCSLSCRQTIELAQAYRSLLLDNGFQSLAESIWERVGRPVYVGRGVAYQFAEWRCGERDFFFTPDRVRRYAWVAGDSEWGPHDGHVAIVHEGPWIRVISGNAVTGTLFMFS